MASRRNMNSWAVTPNTMSAAVTTRRRTISRIVVLPGLGLSKTLNGPSLLLKPSIR